MLRFLRIRNLAVVEGVDVDFDPGFTVLTGETGAGKSIVVEAVGLLLGGRAAADLVRTGESQATVEAVFEDDDGEIVIRRELTAQGRSRAFVNGELTTSAALKTLVSRLVELHGQHEHQALLDPATHLPTLDDFAHLSEQAATVAAAWETLQTARENCERASMDERERSARLDLIAFQLGEIDKAALKSGEDVELGATRQVLANAERVERLCTESYSTLYDSDASVLAQLAGVWRRVDELAEIDPQFADYLQARGEVKAQLEDLAATLRRYGNAIDASPGRLQQIEDRLAMVERLKKKYGPSLDDVIARGAALKVERARLTDPLQEVEALRAERDAARSRYLEAARMLSRARRRAGLELGEKMGAVLAQLAMGQARFEVRLAEQEAPEAQWRALGIDVGEFFIAPNPGEAAKPLARIVSGGELSRVMLALKTLAADGVKSGERLPRTLVFDEVDAGIGGQVAEVVARHLQTLAGRFQVLCVTHLPQIAARATRHYGVAKQTTGNRTRVSVSDLGERDERVNELARMIGGADVTESLRASARELLARRDAKAKPKEKAKGESESRRAAR